jgi:hypothetical protein
VALGRSIIAKGAAFDTRRMTINVSSNLIRTPFGFDSTADEVIAGIDLSGRRAVVTGGASGIRIETARALAHAGADVTLAVRNTKSVARTAAGITAITGNDAVRASPPTRSTRARFQPR